ncbi:MAG: flippase-like domain-containing protein [Candidatus Latescibacteria bacterium]|nr:flippase-like domain-containing protein [Candidatus Latescibacterota bacterium]NIM21460.1 flippase-like domain-containing protein [Candidatus Latescibacterota bacterium]NIM65631.1 flippase-like domain-containing protein [Candidatus Latescibacterota bacterium]NIO02013.1 flippase-like domain-containing protein [Candidatus Latescibacterota bacterium]NIO28825.1 flippase-like domain-containing protein [Candidatus Latescibacterota bacterium]
MRFPKRFFKKIVVYVIAAGCLAWVMSGVRFDELLLHMRSMHLWWVPAALIIDVLCIVSHGFRWKLLVQPVGSVALLRTIQAIYTGLFTNLILPLKPGEFVRGYLLSRWMDLPFASILPSMIAERIFDGSLLVLGIGLCTFFVSLPQKIVNAGVIVGAVILLVIGLIVLSAFADKKYSTTHTTDDVGIRKPIRRIKEFLSQFSSGMRSVWTSVRLLPVLAASMLYVFFQVLSYWMIMKAYGLHVSLWVPAVVLIIVRLGTAVPGAPANIGSYQFFCVIALTLFGIEKTMATGLAILLSLVFTIPILILGFLAFLKSGLTVSELRKGRTQMTSR